MRVSALSRGAALELGRRLADEGRVVRDASRGVRIEPGEVLVAPYTDPAWTPLFLSAGTVRKIPAGAQAEAAASPFPAAAAYMASMTSR